MAHQPRHDADIPRHRKNTGGVFRSHSRQMMSDAVPAAAAGCRSLVFEASVILSENR
jgi:hypothetical protein